MNDNLIRAIARATAIAVAGEKLPIVVTGNISTTDATATAIVSIPTLIYTIGVVEYTVIGIGNDGASAVSVRRVFRYVNNGLTVTLGSESSILPLQTAISGATVTAVVNGQNIDIQVKGAASTFVLWQINYQQQSLVANVVFP